MKISFTPGRATVTSDVLLVLRHDGKTCAPDIAVIRGDLDTSGIERSIPLLQQDARLVFVLEAVSTSSEEIENKIAPGVCSRVRPCQETTSGPAPRRPHP